MEKLAFDLEVKLAGDDAAAGLVKGYGSVFKKMDRGGDIVLPGAFTASLARWREKNALPPMLWQHDPWRPLGVWTELEEDKKGLRVAGQLAMDVSFAKDARALIAAKAVTGLSIGYRTLDYEIDRKTGARLLKEVDLWEISLVTFPMLVEAQISDIKSINPRALEEELRRECNLSNAAAVKAVAIVKQHLRDEGVSTEPDARDGLKDVLMSLRRAQTALS